MCPSSIHQLKSDQNGIEINKWIWALRGEIELKSDQNGIEIKWRIASAAIGTTLKSDQNGIEMQEQRGPGALQEM